MAFNRSDLRAVLARLDHLRRKVGPEASRLALNDIAFEVMYKNRDLMERVFDRPTRFTLNAFYVRKATLANMTAVVERKPMQRGRHYLEVQSDGGRRPLTGIERLLQSRLKYDGIIQAVVPTKHMRRNAYGNMPPGAVQRILSAVQAQSDRMQNTTAASRARSRGRVQYFVPRTDSKLSPGVYERRGKQLRKMLAFSDSVPRYVDRFPMEEHAAKVAAAHTDQAFARAFNTALQRA